ncbi:MAG: hypothetical protein K6A96_11910 [Prevotella sp.]|nr:hypothetical protein [Prevotella sp.]
MDDKDKRQQQAPINVWGIANIGCEMENPTFQTLVVSPEEQKSQEAEIVEEKSVGDDADVEEEADESPADVTYANASGEKRGRPKRTGRKILKSFVYRAFSDEETNLRLQCLYNGLLQLNWIAADTKQKNFLSIFSGEETTCRVVWTGEVSTLAELFKELVSRKKYVKLPEGETIWVMVNARFWDKEGNHEFGNSRLRSTSTPMSSKETIEWLVKLMNPSLPLSSLKEMLQSQR